MSKDNPLISLYGDEAFELAIKEMDELKTYSNVPFDKKYVDLGISFLMIKANEIIKGEKKKINLHSLISESFGEAAIYKYNVKNGML